MSEKRLEDSCKITEKGDLTRRRFMDRVMLTVAGGAVLMLAGTREAEAKVSKMSASYRSSPKMGKSCRGCANYQGSGKCKIVKGTVSSSGYCKFYARKKAYRGSY